MAIPYQDKHIRKKQQVAEMFDNISNEYDRLNRVLSFGIDQRWRKRLVEMVYKLKPQSLLDIATGTADVALSCRKVVNGPIVGVDISNKMLDIGRDKVTKKGANAQIDLRYGDSENLPFEEQYFDAITCSFGVRNFENLKVGLEEMVRVLNKGGKAFILEFSKPENSVLRWGYNLYSKTLLPSIGRMVSKDERAYSYLPESIREFPSGKEFTRIMEEAGFSRTGREQLSFGICTIYWGQK